MFFGRFLAYIALAVVFIVWQPSWAYVATMFSSLLVLMKLLSLPNPLLFALERSNPVRVFYVPLYALRYCIVQYRTPRKKTSKKKGRLR